MAVSFRQSWCALTAVLALLFAAESLPLRAQQAGAPAVAGTVYDQSGKVIPNATVTVKNSSGATAATATTDPTGHFSVAAPLGTYTVEVTSPGFAGGSIGGYQLTPGAQELSITLSVAPISGAVTVNEVASEASELAPVQASLEEFTPHSEINETFLKNFTSPVTDFTNALQYAPGTFSISPNGIGLGQSNIFFRGFPDGDYTITFDGIPFEDTNTPTHHSWVFFPGQWLGGIDFDRSPGTASTIGPTNFGGSINLFSLPEQSDMNIRGTIAYGSWDTRLLSLDYDTGTFDNGKQSLLFNVHQMESSGYQTGNKQKRDGGTMKYQYNLSDKTTLTLFTGIVDLWTNTPNLNGPTRGQVAQYGDNYLLSDVVDAPNWWGFDHYHVQSNFEYLGIHSDLGHGWKFDDKFYFYRYWNNQSYNNSLTTVSATSAVDKLNGYDKPGDISTLSWENQYGIFRTGIWYEWAYTDRYQIPSNPLTGVDSALPNFHEHFITQSLQPFLEYEWRITPKLSFIAGGKLAYYNMELNQFADNGKIVGNLGGAAFVTHDAGYASWLPSLLARYKIHNNWTIYGQFSEGSIIPPSAVFDVKNGAVEVTPKPTMAKTYQFGSVWKINRLSLDGDAYYTWFQNTYTSYVDPVTSDDVYITSPNSITRGVEGEASVFLAHGISFYVNGTAGKAHYQEAGEPWVDQTPRNTESYGLTYQTKNWDAGIFDKRVGSMWNINGADFQAVQINPFSMTNLYVNYTIRDWMHLNQTRFGLAVNNLFNDHSILQVYPASTSSNLASPNDTLVLMAGRSIMATMTVGFSPRK